MIKHFCDVCKQEKKTSAIYLPTLNHNGVSEYRQGNKMRSKNLLGTYQFDLCEECLTNIAMNMYGMTKICASTYEE